MAHQSLYPTYEAAALGGEQQRELGKLRYRPMATMNQEGGRTINEWKQCIRTESYDFTQEYRAVCTSSQ